MPADARHILLMGFKHVGKSSIGRALAQLLGRPFCELDAACEARYLRENGKALSCREIVAQHGEDFFRRTESGALAEVLQQPAGVVALGGGTPMPEANRSLICSQIPVHITAPRDQVFARILVAGWPQVLAGVRDPRAMLEKLWKQREPVYRSLAVLTVCNDSSVEATARKIAGWILNK